MGITPSWQIDRSYGRPSYTQKLVCYFTDNIILEKKKNHTIEKPSFRYISLLYWIPLVICCEIVSNFMCSIFSHCMNCYSSYVVRLYEYPLVIYIYLLLYLFILRLWLVIAILPVLDIAKPVGYRYPCEIGCPCGTE